MIPNNLSSKTGLLNPKIIKELFDNFRSANAKQVQELHINDDVDSGLLSHHHTLGIGPNQAANGALVEERFGGVDDYITSLLSSVSAKSQYMTAACNFLLTINSTAVSTILGMTHNRDLRDTDNDELWIYWVSYDVDCTVAGDGTFVAAFGLNGVYQLPTCNYKVATSVPERTMLSKMYVVNHPRRTNNTITCTATRSGTTGTYRVYNNHSTMLGLRIW